MDERRDVRRYKIATQKCNRDKTFFHPRNIRAIRRLFRYSSSTVSRNRIYSRLSAISILSFVEILSINYLSFKIISRFIFLIIKYPIFNVYLQFCIIFQDDLILFDYSRAILLVTIPHFDITWTFILNNPFPRSDIPLRYIHSWLSASPSSASSIFILDYSLLST